MSVRPIENLPNIWIEKTLVKNRPDRQYGDFALGQAHWSPQRNKNGADVYKFMRDIAPGDIILHLTDNEALTGISTAASYAEDFTGVVGTPWEHQTCYLIRLKNFRYLEPPLTRNTFFNLPYSAELQNLINRGEKHLFFNKEMNLNQGSYLTPAPKALLAILDTAYQSIAPISLVEVIEQTLAEEDNTSQIEITASQSDQDIFDIDEEIPTVSLGKLSERDLLTHIEKYITTAGYYFETEVIYNYHICLKTKPFVILAGLSGTGKSKLSQLYAEAIGHSQENKHYLRLPVRPNWNEDRYILGYFDTITQTYVTEPGLDFINRANQDKNNMYFFCLDEMNLSHVEYYFSQFLSAMEEDESRNRILYLYSSTFASNMAVKNIDHSISLPTNLFITGTVNVDETTQQLSDKVLDRTNTIEFFEVDLEKLPKGGNKIKPIAVTSTDWYSYKALEPDDSYRSLFIAIGKILNEAELGIGYRTVREIETYIANSKDLLSSDRAIDLQIKQKILPRIRGTRAIEDTIRNLITYFESKNLNQSATRLLEMNKRLDRDGYINFWR